MAAGWDGLRRPLNAPPSGAGGLGVQPGAQSPLVTASRVIVTGTHGQVTVFGGQIVLNAPGNTVLQDGGIIQEAAPGLLDFQSGIVAAGDAAAELQLKSITAGGLAYPVIVPANGAVLTPQDPNGLTAETWHAVSVPAGMTGAIRVKVLAVGLLAALDVNVTITSTNVAPTTYTAGSLPAGGYYPLGPRQFPLSVNQQFTTTANASPRVVIPASGAVSLPLPGFNAAGASCIVSGTVFYPLD